MDTGTLQSNKAILKKLFLNAFFVMFMIELLNSAASLIDTYFIGNYIGSDGMAASSYARPFFSFVDIVCGPLGLGMQLVCSHLIGKGDMDRAQKTFSGSLVAGVLISLVLTVIGLTMPSIFTALYGQKNAVPEIIEMAKSYLRGLFVGTPAMIAFGILSPIVQLGAGKKLVIRSVVYQLIADVVGDVLSVFVLDGEMFGLGLATGISYFAALIPLIGYFFRNNAILKLKPMLLTPDVFREVLRSGSSKSIKRICNTFKPIILNVLSLLLGASLALSAYSVTNQVRSILICISAGISGAVVLNGAILFGKGDKDGLKRVSDFAAIGLAAITAIGALCIVFANQIAGFFISDSEEVLQMAALSVRCVGIMIPFATFNGIFISMMQISKRYRLVNVLSYLNRLILIVVTSAVLGVIFGVNGLWWALPVSEIVNAVIDILIVCRINGRFPRSFAELLCLPNDFGYSEKDYIEISLESGEDVVVLSQNVKKFCEDHNIDFRRSYYAQLALEELAMNVIEHGFPKCKRGASLHVWITYEDGDLKMRIQDNCPGFNVMKRCSELQKESKERCVGLRLIAKFSKEMNYVNILDTNNLMITI